MMRFFVLVLFCTPPCLCGVHDIITPQRPLHFIENKGQWDAKYKYGFAVNNIAVGFGERSVTIFERDDCSPLSLEKPRYSPLLKTSEYVFMNTNDNLQLIGSSQSIAKYNYYIGNDRAKWVEHANSYERIVYSNVWPNIDIEYSISDHVLVQTFILHEGANPNEIQIRCSSGSASSWNKSYIVNEDIQYRSAGSILSFMSPVRSIPRKRYFKTEFGTFLCGSSSDRIGDYKLNSRKELVIVGSTGSLDYPLVNPLQPMPLGQMISVFDCEGKSLLFSTRFNGSDGGGDLLALAVNDCDDIIFGGFTYSSDYPVTNNALEKEQYKKEPGVAKGAGILSILSRSGIIKYSTYLNNGYPKDGTSLFFADVVDIKLNNQGDIHVLINSQGYTPYATPNAIYKSTGIRDTNQLNCSLMIFSRNADSVIYATDFPGSCSVAPQSLHVNADGSIVIAMHGGNPRDTLVNPIWNGGTGSPSVYLMKIKPSDRKIVYATLYGGSKMDYPLCVVGDSIGNTYLIGGTNSNDIMITNGFQTSPGQSIPGNYTDAFIAKISSEGKLIASTYLGGNYHDYPTGAVLDHKGNLILTIMSEKIPVKKDGIPDIGDNHYIYLAVIDTSLSSMNYIFPVNYFDDYVTESHRGGNVNRGPNGLLLYDQSGYVYLKSTVGVYFGRGKDKVPVWNAYKSNPCHDGMGDIVLHRLYLPLAGQDYLSCSIQAPDRIRITKNPKFILPSVFDLSVIVTNNDTLLPGIGASVELTLPPGLTPDPANQPLSKTLGRKFLLPGQSDTVTWRVRYEESFTGDSLPVSASVYYDIPHITEACLKAANMSDKDILVLRDQVFTPEVLCLMNAPTTLTTAPTRFSYVEKPFEVRASLRNGFPRDVAIQEIHLVYGKGMAVHHAPGSDSILAVGVLKPNESRDFVWRIIARERPGARNVQFMVIAYDSVGNVVTSCATSVSIPPIVALQCDVIAPVIVRYFPSTNTFIPDPVRITGYLQNTLDTTQNIVKARVSLARASHLELLAGEREDQAPFTNSPNFRRTLYWALKAKPVSGGENDTVVVHYRTELGNTEDSCEAIVRFVIINAELSCSLTGPDSLQVRGSSYTPHPFVISYQLQNSGQSQVRNLKTRLSLSSNAITSADQLERTLTDLAPSQSHRYTWILLANTSKYNRTVTLTVITEDSLGTELTRCEKTIFLPRIHPSLTCTLEAPDTIAYDLISDIHTPNPFTAALTLQNLLDTAEVNIETEIDLTAAPHIALVHGEPSRKMINEIAAHSQQSVIYNIEIAQRTDAPITERITIRYRAENDNAWQACEKVILIEGKERTLSASCSAYGPDSLFGDPAYERFIPEPAQFVYAITNTGTLPLTGCTATIIVPQDFTLVAGDATQSYGVIMPGQTVWREWSLIPAQNAPLATSTVRWQWSCDSIQTNDCTRDITLTAGAPIGLVLAPWKLRFEAEQGASLPSERTVSLWPGGGASLLWQSTNGTAWLDWSPKSESGGQRSDIRVQPNTTAMPVGIYSDAITITATDPVRPPQIEVEYEIWKVLSAKNTPSPTGVELQSWPNPTSGMTNVEFRIPHGGFVRLVLHDVYGREVGVLSEGILSGGRHTIRNDVSRLSGGVYYYTLTTATDRMTKMMVVRR